MLLAPQPDATVPLATLVTTVSGTGAMAKTRRMDHGTLPADAKPPDMDMAARTGCLRRMVGRTRFDRCSDSVIGFATRPPHKSGTPNIPQFGFCRSWPTTLVYAVTAVHIIDFSHEIWERTQRGEKTPSLVSLNHKNRIGYTPQIVVPLKLLIPNSANTLTFRCHSSLLVQRVVVELLSDNFGSYP